MIQKILSFLFSPRKSNETDVSAFINSFNQHCGEQVEFEACVKGDLDNIYNEIKSLHATIDECQQRVNNLQETLTIVSSIVRENHKGE